MRAGHGHMCLVNVPSGQGKVGKSQEIVRGFFQFSKGQVKENVGTRSTFIHLIISVNIISSDNQ